MDSLKNENQCLKKENVELKDEACILNQELHLIQEENIKIAEKNQNLEKENLELKESRLCSICMTNQISIAFLNCGHFVTCVECSNALRDCPMCRIKIMQRINVYMS